jgi:hypothetical protein
MIVTRLKFPLEQAEYSALLKMAGDELRNPIDQAHFLLRQEFERRGLLPIIERPMPAQAAQDIQPQGVTHDSD